MTESATAPPRRQGFGPVPQIEALRERPGVARVPTPFGPEAW